METIITINEDPKATIFREANYRITSDLFTLMAVLKRNDHALELENGG